jgi:hypothetical protein
MGGQGAVARAPVGFSDAATQRQGVLKSLFESAEHNTDNREALKVLIEWPPLWWAEWLERMTGFQ